MLHNRVDSNIEDGDYCSNTSNMPVNDDSLLAPAAPFVEST